MVVSTMLGWQGASVRSLRSRGSALRAHSPQGSRSLEPHPEEGQRVRGCTFVVEVGLDHRSRAHEFHAQFTRRLLVNGGFAWIEEERIRESDDVRTQSFPADEFPMWSLGVDVRIHRGLLVGFVHEWSFDHDVD